jgi:molybdenum-dependent DNA-binding transcriptional regulator ModE
MNTRFLATLRTVAQTGSLAAAARQMNQEVGRTQRMTEKGAEAS